MGWQNEWATRAACRGTDPDTLFVQGAAQNRAKAVSWKRLLETARIDYEHTADDIPVAG